MHTHTNTHTHARTHARTQAQTQTLTTHARERSTVTNAADKDPASIASKISKRSLRRSAIALIVSVSPKPDLQHRFRV